MTFVPPDFDVPTSLETPLFTLEPLGPQHNDADFAAYRPLEANRRDLERHAEDFRKREGFTYTVLEPSSADVIGCVYIYPVPGGNVDARVLSWERADRADLDAELWCEVGEWLRAEWPFEKVDYAPR